MQHIQVIHLRGGQVKSDTGAGIERVVLHPLRYAGIGLVERRPGAIGEISNAEIARAHRSRTHKPMQRDRRAGGAIAVSAKGVVARGDRAPAAGGAPSHQGVSKAGIGDGKVAGGDSAGLRPRIDAEILILSGSVIAVGGFLIGRGVRQPPFDTRKRHGDVGKICVTVARVIVIDRRVNVGGRSIGAHPKRPQHRTGTTPRGGHKTHGRGGIRTDRIARLGPPVEGKIMPGALNRHLKGGRPTRHRHGPERAARVIHRI